MSKCTYPKLSLDTYPNTTYRNLIAIAKMHHFTDAHYSYLIQKLFYLHIIMHLNSDNHTVGQIIDGLGSGESYLHSSMLPYRIRNSRIY